MRVAVAFVPWTAASLADADLVNAAPAFAVDHFSPGGGTHACSKALLAGTLDFAVTAGGVHESKTFLPQVLRKAPNLPVSKAFAIGLHSSLPGRYFGSDRRRALGTIWLACLRLAFFVQVPFGDHHYTPRPGPRPRTSRRLHGPPDRRFPGHDTCPGRPAQTPGSRG